MRRPLAAALARNLAHIDIRSRPGENPTRFGGPGKGVSHPASISTAQSSLREGKYGITAISATNSRLFANSATKQYQGWDALRGPAKAVSGLIQACGAIAYGPSAHGERRNEKRRRNETERLTTSISRNHKGAAKAPYWGVELAVNKLARY